MRVAGKRRAIGVIGGEEDAPWVSYAQKQLQANCPLQRVDIILVTIFKRHYATACVAFNIHNHRFFRTGVFGI